MSARFPTLHRIRRLLQGPCVAPPRWLEHREIFRRAVFLVQVFYAVTAYRLYDAGRELTLLTGSVEDLDLLWPVLWMDFVSMDSAVWILVHLALGSSLLGLLLWRFFAVRVLVSLALLQLMALVRNGCCCRRRLDLPEDMRCNSA